ncbi:MAG: thiamine phosphate synthase, partial [Solirubrobacteraceae bacterium]|nr:thiamine phosphate synthase [Solirubrobacteraceae bacterium]
MPPVTREERLARLQAARLYLVTPLAPGGRALEGVLSAALQGGVDIVQLRDKDADDGELLAAAAVARRLCDATGALLIVNDRPDLVEPARADGVHVGQDDATVAQARAIAGDDVIVGRSTHAPAQLAAAADDGADYAAVGPVHATPTKPGRAPVGLDYVRHAADRARLPWFAIGGLMPENTGEVVAAGAHRIVVVRAIADADDPRAAAASLQ